MFQRCVETTLDLVNGYRDGWLPKKVLSFGLPPCRFRMPVTNEGLD